MLRTLIGELSTTVVIPAFNRERFVAKAIDSVLAQTRPPNEIIVVDDGSTDGTVEVVRQYGNRIRLIKIDNNGSGPSRPRNVGIDAATSEFVTLLDSDDYFEPQLLERHAELLHLSPEIDLIGGNYQRYWSDSGELRQNMATAIAACEKETLGANRFRVPSAQAYAALCRGNFLVSCTGTTFRKSLWQKIGGYDETLSTSNDYDFFLRAARHCDLGYIDEPLFVYVFHDANISAANLNRDFKPHRFHNRLRVLTRELALAASSEVSDTLSAAIARNLMDLAWAYRHACKYGLSLRYYLAAFRYANCRAEALRGIAKIPFAWLRDMSKRFALPRHQEKIA